MGDVDLYALLGVGKNASSGEIKKVSFNLCSFKILVSV